MQRERIPVSYMQIALIGLLVTIPVLVAAGVVFASPSGGAAGNRNWALMVGLLILSGGLSAAVCGSMLARRWVEVCEDVLTVRSSFYTVSLKRSEFKAVVLTKIADRTKLGITTKRNGIAAFGFFSGWFNADHVDLIFCAVSTLPVCSINFSGHPACSALAISYNEPISKLLTTWSGCDMTLNSTGEKI